MMRTPLSSLLLTCTRFDTKCRIRACTPVGEEGSDVRPCCMQVQGIVGAGSDTKCSIVEIRTNAELSLVGNNDLKHNTSQHKH